MRSYNSDDIILKGLTPLTAKDEYLLSFSYVWIEIDLVTPDYYGTDYEKFEATNDLGIELTDRLYFNTHSTKNDMKWTVLKKLHEKDLDEKPDRVYKFYEYFSIDKGNSMVFEDYYPESSFNLKTEDEVRFLNKESEI